MTATIDKMPKSKSELDSGEMDRRIERKTPKWLKPAMMAGVIAIALPLIFIATRDGGGRLLRVSGETLVISDVVQGRFEDFIPVRGRVTPFRTVFLDAIEGGRVEEVLVEDGALVESGQLLVRLSNTSLQLDVIAREAEVTEQLNNLNNLELSLEQNRLSHKSNLVEIDYQIIRLTRLADRRRQLVAEGHVSQQDLEDVEDELTFWSRRKEVTLEAQETDERLQKAQMEQISAAVEQLNDNLAFAGKNLDSLNVRAPVPGKLTAFSVEVGQSFARGERLGQIDDPTIFKLAADIDEFYLGRVDIGQQAVLTTNGDEYALQIQKIYPQVRNGQFQVDIVFNEETPDNIRRGQTFQTKLSLGDSAEAVLIPNGAFYQDTGGAWIFVVRDDGKQAVRRTVKLGRRNATFIEVLDGLELGERIITSPYTSYLDIQRLDLES